MARKSEIEYIRQAIEETGIERKKTLWKHLIEQCYVDNTVLVAVAKKFMPDLTKTEITSNRIILTIEDKNKAIEAPLIENIKPLIETNFANDTESTNE